ncbi:glycosyltransferase family 25 protein [Patellaria atrata CBS 101060]|uniref:Glycosyltransferase family 25 protein n=1 Tax=Patellaria atrata CBS 101060 TaxID=1346257 RepID=A0A9P4SJY3_9PEZI|nr:glycosyltransferase family 25 protein [Patellaria atrata CBS 101060]
MRSFTRRAPLLFVLPICLFVAIAVSLWASPIPQRVHQHYLGILPIDHSDKAVSSGPNGAILRDLATNRTLGFQAILALTRKTPWRFDGLNAAANLTGLDILAPDQRGVSEERMLEFINKADFHPGNGSAIAWLSHLDLLEHIIDQNYQTALILEDDVDWDVTIKDQMRKVSEGVRALLPSPPPAEPGNHTFPAPYGMDWDVLWIGNCGENVADAMPTLKQKNATIKAWYDSTVIPHELYKGWAHNSVLQLPKGTRAALKAKGPVCTFAYAVTFEGAKKLHEFGSTAGDQAFDVKLQRLCSGETKKLECVTVIPEVFHEYKPKMPEGTSSSEINVLNRPNKLQAAGEEDEIKMGYTQNIVDSARCKAVYNMTCSENEKKAT